MKKKLFALGAAAVLALGLASCGETSEGGTSNVIKLEYSGTASDKEFNLGLFEDFKAARKAAGDTHEYQITYVEHGPDKVDSEVQDWVVGPDVFEFASDKITALYEKGALARVSGANATFIEEKNSDLGKDLATFNGEFYAYPYTGDNTYYLQYDKSKLTAAQAGSIESILAVCAEEGLKLGYNLEEAFWGAGALFTFGADYKMTFDEDGAVHSVTADFDGEKGLKAAKALVTIMTNPCWQNAMEAPTPTNGLIGCIAGTWDIATYKEALGDNYACAPMPTITIDGETKNLGAFLGGKLFGINPQRAQGNAERLAAAHELAKFLSDKECQLKRFDKGGIAPCNLEAAAESRVLADANVKCLVEQAKFAHAQTAVPANFWSAPNTFTASIKAGDVTLDNLEGLQTAITQLNDSVKASK
ncbi:MAG: extracellular solute-binding protein [Roseburia sp.]|nr:extracellular solute-binding protein [Anaeroplasma bactoclasticum]MCM1195977.1 extracellular solute-binding protein [Roseburia sp.]MCM1556411.1 extracellular solute-binding protein [Anaeroplasma bactoclasticum]